MIRKNSFTTRKVRIAMGLAFLLSITISSRAQETGQTSAVASATGENSALEIPAPPPMALKLAPGQKLRPGDAVFVRVLDEGTVSGAFRVGEDGLISYPLIGKLTAASLTLDELALEITQLLEKNFIRKADVAVTMTDRQQSSVYVYGAVQRQGPVNFDPGAGLPLGRAMSIVGGPSEMANLSRVKIDRSSGGELSSKVVDLNREQEFALQDGDIIVVPIMPSMPVATETTNETAPKLGRAFVMGQVNRTGAISLPLEEGADILEVIAVSGGFTRLARPSKVRIRRSKEDGTTENFEVDVEKMNKGQDTTGFRILPGDTVFVPENPF
jgi:polysaccharide export outer membrane protein